MIRCSVIVKYLILLADEPGALTLFVLSSAG